MKLNPGMMLTKPIAIQVNGNEGRRDGEIVDQRVQFHKEQQLLGGCNELFGKIPFHQGSTKQLTSRTGKCKKKYIRGQILSYRSHVGKY